MFAFHCGLTACISPTKWLSFLHSSRDLTINNIQFHVYIEIWMRYSPNPHALLFFYLTKQWKIFLWDESDEWRVPQRILYFIPIMHEPMIYGNESIRRKRPAEIKMKNDKFIVKLLRNVISANIWGNFSVLYQLVKCLLTNLFFDINIFLYTTIFYYKTRLWFN